MELFLLDIDFWALGLFLPHTWAHLVAEKLRPGEINMEM